MVYTKYSENNYKYKNLKTE